MCECIGKSKEHKRIGENASSYDNWKKEHVCGSIDKK